MFDLKLIVKAAAAALLKKEAQPKTIGLHAGDAAAHIDLTAAHQLQMGANPMQVQHMAEYWRNRLHGTPDTAAASQAAEHAAARARAMTTPAATQALARKVTPTTSVHLGNTLAHAAQTAGPQKVIAGAVGHGMPVAGTASVLDQLMRSGGSALGFVGKHAGLADRPYMRGATETASKMKSKIPVNAATALKHGIPAIFGAVHGAESMPEHKMLGAAAGAAGAVGGAELGGRSGRALGRAAGGTRLGETFGELIGRIIGSGAGQDIAVRGARLAVY